MKIKLLLNLGTLEYGADALREGVHDVDDAFGRRLIAQGRAVAIAQPKAKLQAQAGNVELDPPIATSEAPPEITTTAKPPSRSRKPAAKPPSRSRKPAAKPPA